MTRAASGFSRLVNHSAKASRIPDVFPGSSFGRMALVEPEAQSTSGNPGVTLGPGDASLPRCSRRFVGGAPTSQSAASFSSFAPVPVPGSNLRLEFFHRGAVGVVQALRDIRMGYLQIRAELSEQKLLDLVAFLLWSFERRFDVRTNHLRHGLQLLVEKPLFVRPPYSSQLFRQLRHGSVDLRVVTVDLFLIRLWRRPIENASLA